MYWQSIREKNRQHLSGQWAASGVGGNSNVVRQIQEHRPWCPGKKTQTAATYKAENRTLHRHLSFKNDGSSKGPFHHAKYLQGQ